MFIVTTAGNIYRGCELKNGDGRGGTEFKIGMQAGTACIDACLQHKQTDDSINGVTLFANNDGGCWCEKGMTQVQNNGYGYYKSCFITGGIVNNTCYLLLAYSLKCDNR